MCVSNGFMLFNLGGNVLIVRSPRGMGGKMSRGLRIAMASRYKGVAHGRCGFWGHLLFLGRGGRSIHVGVGELLLTILLLATCVTGK